LQQNDGLIERPIVAPDRTRKAGSTGTEPRSELVDRLLLLSLTERAIGAEPPDESGGLVSGKRPSGGDVMSEQRWERDGWVLKVLGFDVATSAPPNAYTVQRAEFEPRLLAAMAANPENRTVLSALLSAADQMAADGKTDRALATLSRIADELNRMPSGGDASRARAMGIEPGLVARRRADLEAELRKRIEASEAEVAAQVAGFGPSLEEIIEDPAAFLSAVRTHMDGLFERILQEIQATLKRDDDLARARQEIAALHDRIAGDPALAALAKAASVFKLDDPTTAIATMFADAQVILDRQPA